MRTAISLTITIAMAALMLSPDLQLKVLNVTYKAFLTKYKQSLKDGVLPGHRKLMSKSKKEWSWLYEPVPPDKLASSLKPD